MPQVDLEILVSACAGGDSKIACETLSDGNDEQPQAAAAAAAEQQDPPPDLPPESFWLVRSQRVLRA